MTVLSRRAALLAACGSVAGGASVGTWLVREWVRTAPTPGKRIRTAFGAVVLLASRREPADASPVDGPGVDGASAPSAVESDQVVVLVEVRNDSAGSVRIAPGQFQLRVGEVGPAVAILGAEPYGGVVAPGRVLQLRLTFLVPSGDGSYGLEFQEFDRPVSTVTARARSRTPGGTPATTMVRGPARGRPVAG